MAIVLPTDIQDVTSLQEKILNMVEIAIGETFATDSSENPLGSDITKYGKWYGFNDKWCMMFVQWCANQAKIRLPRTASCGKFVEFAIASGNEQQGGMLVEANDEIKKGDIIIFTWANGVDKHTGIAVTDQYGSIKFDTVEGNTGNSGEKDYYVRRKKYELSATFFNEHNIKSIEHYRIRKDNYAYLEKQSSSPSNNPNPGDGGGPKNNNTYPNNTIDTDTGYPTNWITLTQSKTPQDVEYNISKINTVEQPFSRPKANNLLSFPSFVEAPFILVKIDKYTLGVYVQNLGAGSYLGQNIDFPNFITRLNIVKVNGTVNTYTINMTYQIEAGNDPNLIDKILSTVGYGIIKISYGDCKAPTFIYKEEEALIIDVKTDVDFNSSRINYTITCQSNALSLFGGYYPFPEYLNTKPSNVIISLLQQDNYGLTDVFKGMKNYDNSRGWIRTDDKPVNIPAKKSMDVVSYINFLVTCMIPESTSTDSVLQDGTYFLTVHDDVSNEFGGSYFTINKVQASLSSLPTIDTYELDIGFPSDNFVTSFKINNDNSWSLIYKYSENIQQQQYIYKIDDSGRLTRQYSPNMSTSGTYYETTPMQKTWWTRMTQFPITATVVIKGLLRPALLMTYVRINAMFYGQRHVSSGLYVITKQEDTIDGTGYRTTLTLLRVAGDDDYISLEKAKTQTQGITPKTVYITTDPTPVNPTPTGGGSGSTTKTTPKGPQDQNITSTGNPGVDKIITKDPYGAELSAYSPDYGTPGLRTEDGVRLSTLNDTVGLKARRNVEVDTRLKKLLK